MSIHDTVRAMGQRARDAAFVMAQSTAADRNRALRQLATLLRDHGAPLQAENARDLARATDARLDAPLLDRLKLTPKVLETCAAGCDQLAAMADIIGEIVGQAVLDDIFQAGKPFGSMLEDHGSPFALLGFLLSVPVVATARFLSYIDTRTRADGWDIQVRFLGIASKETNDRRLAA